MPLAELGYRHYDGPLRPERLRWWVITRTGIRLLWRSRFLRRLVLLAWLPLLYFGPLFFAIGTLTDPDAAEKLREVMQGMVGEIVGAAIANQAPVHPEQYRPLLWTFAFAVYFAMVQGLLVLLMVAVAGPGLIANDMRTKAFLVYFSKPITCSEYLLGKLATVVFYVFLITLVPALVLYAISIALSPSLSVALDTASVLPRLVGCSLAVALPTSLIVLLFSSWTTHPRFATVGWIATCLFGFAFARVLENTPAGRDSRFPFLLSIYDCVATLQKGILDLSGQIPEQLRRVAILGNLPSMQPRYSPWIALAFLAGLCAICVLLILRRLRRLTRA